LFPPQQLEDLLKSLIKNCSELLEYDVHANSHWPSCAIQLTPQLGEAVPDKLVKKLKYKEVMGDRLAEIIFIWQGVAHCPQVLNSLPNVCTKLRTVLEDFTLSLVRVHTFSKAELEEEQNTSKALWFGKKTGKFVLCQHSADQPFIAHMPLYPNASKFLNVGTKVRKLVVGDTAEAYEKMVDDHQKCKAR
jgi:hypothetical protein